MRDEHETETNVPLYYNNQLVTFNKCKRSGPVIGALQYGFAIEGLIKR